MSVTTVPERPAAKCQVTPDDLISLARFTDPGGNAVSFYFQLSSATDNSHRREVLLIRNMMRKILSQIPEGHQSQGLIEDLEALQAISGEIRKDPARLTAVFACFDQHVWQAYSLPAIDAETRLEAGRHFNLAPLLEALESCTPYAVVAIERDKIRGFAARGAEIEEVKDFFNAQGADDGEEEPQARRPNYSWKKKHERTRVWARALPGEIQRFMALLKCSHLVIGCRDDQWHEISRDFGAELLLAVAGRFHLPGFDITPEEALALASPMFRAYQHKRRSDFFHEIEESPVRRVMGTERVLSHLQDGRLQKLLLGLMPEQKISECPDCGRMQVEPDAPCRTCGNRRLETTSAEAALARQAVLTDVEVLVAPAEEKVELNAVAGLRR